MTSVVAFQGERGAYSEEAVVKYFGEGVSTLPLGSMWDVFEAVTENRVDFAVVPVENSIEGGVNEVMGLLRGCEVKVVGEVMIRVVHCFICNPGAQLGRIRFVYSHPQALGQCRKFLGDSGLRAIPFYDTAGSVKEIVGKTECAAIASKRAAEIYKMRVVVEGIEDNKKNFTRFFVITAKHEIPRPTGSDKTSVIFSLKHRAGELFRSLEAFAARNINLTRIESRPAPDKLWEYDFFVDFEGHVEDSLVKEALMDLRERTTFLKVLGSYPKAGT